LGQACGETQHAPVWRNILLGFTSFNPTYGWGIWRGQEIEGWGDGTLAPHEAQRSAGVRLLDEWGFFHRPEPRLARIRWMRPFESLFRTLRIYHFQLGEAEV